MVFTNFCIESVYLATRKKEGREWYWQIATSFLQPLIWIVSFSLSSMSSISIRILRLYPLLSLASRGDKRKAFVSKIRSILTTRIRQLFLFKEGRRRGGGGMKNMADNRSTSRQFPSSAYITHTISGYRSRLILATSLPRRLGGGTLYIILSSLLNSYFSKSLTSRYYLRGGAAWLLSLRNSAATREEGNQLRREGKIHSAPRG